jgi:hypothetical protein
MRSDGRGRGRGRGTGSGSGERKAHPRGPKPSRYYNPI